MTPRRSSKSATGPAGRSRRANGPDPAGSPLTWAAGQQGFSYAEVLAAVLVLAISLPAALDALGSATRAAGAHEASTARRYLVSGRMEQVLAETQAALDAAAVAAGAPTSPTSYSDPAGTPNRRLVFLARYDIDNADGDGNPFTGGDAGLIWARVQIENQPIALETVTGS